MTEHSVYDHKIATPVVPEPGFSRSGQWSFRSIRAPEGVVQPEAAEPEAAARITMATGRRAVSLDACPERPTMGDPRSGRAAGRISAQDIYTGHFGLRMRPFSLVPDPDFLFWSTAHQHAYAMLEFGIVTRAPITLITGEIGTGKTTLVFEMLQALPDDLTVGFITNTQGTPEELMRWVLLALGRRAPTKACYPDLVGAIQDFVVDEYADGRRVVLILDEAQNLSAATLEALRMLTNINSNKDELLQLVLVGQPELRDMVSRPALKQFAQRVTASYRLTAMDLPATKAYITHRLRVAGARRGIFSEAATEAIHRVAGGVPRLVNQLCDLAMVYAFSAELDGVVRQTVEDVLSDGTFFGADLVEPARLQ